MNNRGGKLLQEQRQHQKVNKDLPKVVCFPSYTFLISLSLSLKTEKKLQSILQQWEEDHSRHFIVNDQRYLDDVESRWDNYHQAKEEEKLKRVSHKTQNVTFNNLLATNQS